MYVQAVYHDVGVFAPQVNGLRIGRKGGEIEKLETSIHAEIQKRSENSGQLVPSSTKWSERRILFTRTTFGRSWLGNFDTCHGIAQLRGHNGELATGVPARAPRYFRWLVPVTEIPMQRLAQLGSPFTEKPQKSRRQGWMRTIQLH